MKRILFVDDEPKVLEALKRMLYPLRNEWDMAFAGSGREALRLLSEYPFDVMVTDIRMPQMSGIELLTEVLQRHPQVIRMVLSGTADHEVTLPSVMLAHQYLVKPCDAKTLRATVERASNLRLMLRNPELKRLISRIHSLPSIPTVYTELIQALQDPDVSPKEIGRIIAQDLAMTAKILQLVNSAFFGIHRQITNPTEAVIYLGSDTLRALALTVSVFSQFDTRSVPSFSIEAMRNHGLAVATVAKHIAQSLQLSKLDTEDAFLGGLLHELGKLVLACNYPREYEEAVRKSQAGKLSSLDAEQEVFGASHAEVGAYLLWLWGLPDPVTEIVARYYQPNPEQATRPLVAVHVANALTDKDPEQRIDVECLKAMGLAENLPAWRGLPGQVLAEMPAC